jgi:AraC family cel operon transcriptional repressor
MKYLSWNRFIKQGEITHHAVLHHLKADAVQKMHGHHFTEVFWGISGECVHDVNGREERFSKGEIILLRSRDIHELRCTGDKPFLYYLVSFPNRLLARIKKRYFSDDDKVWGENRDFPLKYKLPPKLYEWLNAAIYDLIGNPDDSLAIDRFLMNLIFEIRNLEVEPYYACPDWLRKTLELVENPEYFSKGPRVLATLSGRTYEHVSRTLKHHTGLSPSEYLNKVRIEYAAGQLVVTDTPILGISTSCGFGTLGRFYSLFKKRYGLPPRQYRLRYRCIINNR